MPKLPAALLSPGSLTEWAIYWARRGFPVFPLVPRGKEPLIARRDGGRGKDDATTDEAQIRQWWAANPNANIGGRMDGRIALDIDVKNGASWDDVADLTGGSRHLSGRGDGGGHLIYRLTATQQLQVGQVAQAKYTPGVDIRIDTRGYVVLPPSLHPEGKQAQYTIESDHEDPLPDPAWQRLLVQSGAKPPGGKGKPEAVAPVRSLLSELLERVPERGLGKANDWLAAVCGHYAKQYARQEDLYLLHARQASAKLDPPLDDAEKTIDSIWRTEKRRVNELLDQVAQAGPDQGWLFGTGRELLCPVWVGEKQNRKLVGESWADFDLKCHGVVLDQDGRATEWVVTLTRARDGVSIDTTMGTDVLADAKRLAAWCARLRVSIAPPERGQEGRGSGGVRLIRYLESQSPAAVRRIGYLGWDDVARGFVTHDGVIQPGRVLTLDQAAVRPASKLVGDAQFYYGFERNRADALAALAEVLTFQDETVASVFGSWWALCLIKGQLMRFISQFPLMAIEAASESGKTTGFFDLMLQLAGSRHRPGMPTYPVIRDRIGAHRSGIVWVDDRDELEPYYEVFRAASTEEVISKNAENRTDTVDFPMVAPVLVSGEALGISDQKALVDRFVRLELPAGIKQRRSVKDPTRLQWADVLDLREQYPEGLGGLSVVAGWLVQEALRRADDVIGLIKQLQTGSGRWGDAMTLLRVGARLLDAVLSDVTGAATAHAQQVDRWVGEQTDPGEENTLTRLILPAALRAHGEPAHAEFEPLGRATVTTPAFIEKSGVIRYSTVLLAEWWAKHRQGRVRIRTETPEALAAQAVRLAGDNGGSVRVKGAPGSLTQRYRRLSPELSQAVLERARGGAADVTTGGVTAADDSRLPLTLQRSTQQLVDEDRW